MQLKHRLDAIERNVALLDDFAITTLSRAATWLAPLVPAALVFSAAQRHIVDVGPVQAAIIAAVVELLGIGVVSNWLNASNYNRHVGPDQRLPMRPYIALVVMYAALVLVVVVGLKVAPAVFAWGAIVALSLLSLASAVAFVQRRHLSALLAEIDEEHAIERDMELRKKRAAHRQQMRSMSAADAQQPAQNRETAPDVAHLNAQRRAKAEHRRAQLEAMLDASGGLRTNEIAEALSISANTVRKDLEAVGAYKNGDGAWHL